MISRKALLTATATALALAACSQGGSQTAQAPAPAAAAAKPEAPAQPQIDAAVAARLAAVNQAAFRAPDAPPAAMPADATPAANGNATGNEMASAPAAASSKDVAPDPLLIKAEVLLARADFSPGVIDGKPGTNLRHAVAAYAKANGVESDGDLTDAVWSKLSAAGGGPVASAYTLTDADVSGPWAPETNDDLAKAKGLDKLGYTNAVEALAERFHMSTDLLRALNPGVDFTKAGVQVAVADPGQLTLGTVDHVEVDKAAEMVRAYDADGKVLAAFPATIGSTERPSPSGVHKVNGVARDPTYTYDPKKLTWGPKKLGKLTVAAGPNNPVGAVWIDLDAPSYGLHGTPEPEKIGKTASHGCVRMTNWDALLLASGVKPGVKVTFLKS